MMRSKKDANQTAIVEALRKAGAYVKIVSIHPKLLDLLVYHRGQLYWIEVKANANQKLTQAEAQIFDACPGVTHIVRNVEDALRVINVVV